MDYRHVARVAPEAGGKIEELGSRAWLRRGRAAAVVVRPDRTVLAPAYSGARLWGREYGLAAAGQPTLTYRVSAGRLPEDPALRTWGVERLAGSAAHDR